MQSSSTVRAARKRSFVTLFALAALTMLLAAPSALAWHGDLVVRKVNAGGPSTDQFGFKVEKSAYASGAYGAYSTLSTSAYSGASFNGATKPPNPFTLLGSTDGTFKTGPTGATQATFTYIDADGESAIAAPDIRDWNRFKVTETSKPAGYKTTIGCVIVNKGSGKSWDASLNTMWGPWNATVSGDSVWTTLRWLPDTAGYDYKGEWKTTCTFTNTYRTRIKVIKDFVNAPSDARVDVKVNGNDVDTSTGAETFGDDAATNWIEVDGGSNVSLAEYGTATANLGDYTQKLECRKGTNGSYGSWFTVTNGTLSSVYAGKDYECKFTNTRKSGKIRVLKFTNPTSITSGFDLRINGSTAGTGGNVGNGGDTGEVTVPTGTHTVSETAAGGGAISGFASKYRCVKNPTSPVTAASFGGMTGTSTSVTVGENETWVCAFLNTKDGTFKVVKQFEGPSGEDKVNVRIDGVQQDVAGSDPATKAFGDGDMTAVKTYPAGSSVSFGESATGDTDLSRYDISVSCTNGYTWPQQDPETATAPSDDDQWATTVGAGQDVVCTITNKRQTAHIEVIKKLIPSTDTGTFDLRLNGVAKAQGVGDDGTTTRLEVPTGDYAVAERAADGTELEDYASTIACEPREDGPAERSVPTAGTSTDVTLNAGDDVVCTFTNTRKSTFKVIKKFEGPSGSDTVAITVNGEGQNVGSPKNSPRAGTPAFGDGDGTQTFTVQPGDSIRFGETGSEGVDLSKYDVKVECVDQADKPVSYSLDGDWYVHDIPAGTNVVCTIYNTRQSGRITLKKILKPAGSGEFNLKLDGENTSVVQTDGDTTFGDQDQTDAIQVATGQHTVAEMAAEGTNATDFVMGAPVCVNRIADVATFSRDVPATEVPVQVDEDGRLDVTPGSDILCTFTNEQKGTVIIKKVTNPASADAFAFSGDLGAFNVTAGTDGQAFKVAPGKSYAVTEDPANGYSFGSAVCEESAKGEDEASSVSGTTATANVQPGETVTCTFTNNKIPQNVPVSPSGGVSPSGDVSPVTPSGGVTARKGTARISGTVGCAAGTFAVSSVRGSQIKRVTFFVNGKKVQTLTKPNAGTQYRYRARTTSLKFGSYKVRARVEFVTASGTKAKDLRLTYSRCKPRVVRPQFTG
jgi:hypothetical protein